MAWWRSSWPRPRARSRRPPGAASRRPARCASGLGRSGEAQRARARGGGPAFRAALGIEALRRADHDRAAVREVNALGDEVNETARIEACATGGLAARAPRTWWSGSRQTDAMALRPRPRSAVIRRACRSPGAPPRRPAATRRRSRSASYSRTSVSLNAGHVLGLRTDREQGPFIRQALERVGSRGLRTAGPSRQPGPSPCGTRGPRPVRRARLRARRCGQRCH